MKILVTGDGFLAYNLYLYLRNINAEVRIWNYTLHNHQDILDYESLSKAVEGKDLVIHTAALTHVDYSISKDRDSRRRFITVNHTGTFNVLEACREHKVKLIHISSSEVYGSNINPGTPMIEEHPLIPMSGTYGVSKASGDMEARVAYEVWGQDVIILRPFNLYGYNQSVEKLIPRFIMLANQGKPLTIHGNGEQKRDYLFTYDLAEAIWKCKDLPAGTILNVATEKAWSINEIAGMIGSCMKVYVEKDTPRPNDLGELLGSYQKIKKLTGWTPQHLLPDTIQLLVNWYTANGIIQPPQDLEGK